MQKNTFWNVPTHDLDVHVLCTCVYYTHCRQSLPRLTSQKGLAESAPKQLYIFFKHINRNKQLLKKLFSLSVSIYSYVWKKKKFYFQVTLTSIKKCSSFLFHIHYFLENEIKTEKRTQRSPWDNSKDWSAPQGILCTTSLGGGPRKEQKMSQRNANNTHFWKWIK